MISMETFARHPLVQAIGWALLHFLWQGTLVALLLAAVFVTARSRSAQFRYGMACLALLLMSLCPPVTCALLYRQFSARTYAAVAIARTTVPISVTSRSVPTLPARLRLPRVARQPGSSLNALSWLVLLWFVGVLILSIRMLGAWMVVQRVRTRCSHPAAKPLQEAMHRIALRMGVRHLPHLLESTLVTAPVMMGGIRTVILLPASAVTGLSTPMLEALLAHELAHVQRHDYLVNLWQTVVETLLFYHPALWWVSQRIRVEREHCCDDRVVATLQDGLTYARALATLEEMRAPMPALAATDGELLARIRRILSGETSMPSKSNPAFLALSIGVAAVVAMPMIYTYAAHAGQRTKSGAPTEQQMPSYATAADPAILAGLTEVHGPGVVVTLRDSNKPADAARNAPLIIRDSDLQAVVNELYVAGAEAVAIGDQRLTNRSAIRAGGTAIQVNGRPITGPFVIRAIGDSSALADALNAEHGFLDSLRASDPAVVRLEKREELVLPAYRGPSALRFAKPVAQSEEWTEKVKTKSDEDARAETRIERRTAMDQKELERARQNEYAELKEARRAVELAQREAQVARDRAVVEAQRAQAVEKQAQEAVRRQTTEEQKRAQELALQQAQRDVDAAQADEQLAQRQINSLAAQQAEARHEQERAADVAKKMAQQKAGTRAGDADRYREELAQRYQDVLAKQRAELQDSLRELERQRAALKAQQLRASRQGGNKEEQDVLRQQQNSIAAELEALAARRAELEAQREQNGNKNTLRDERQALAAQLRTLAQERAKLQAEAKKAKASREADLDRQQLDTDLENLSSRRAQIQGSLKDLLRAREQQERAANAERDPRANAGTSAASSDRKALSAQMKALKAQLDRIQAEVEALMRQLDTTNP